MLINNLINLFDGSFGKPGKKGYESWTYKVRPMPLPVRVKIFAPHLLALALIWRATPLEGNWNRDGKPIKKGIQGRHEDATEKEHGEQDGKRIGKRVATGQSRKREWKLTAED